MGLSISSAKHWQQLLKFFQSFGSYAAAAKKFKRFICSNVGCLLAVPVVGALETLDGPLKISKSFKLEGRSMTDISSGDSPNAHKPFDVIKNNMEIIPTIIFRFEFSNVKERDWRIVNNCFHRLVALKIEWKFGGVNNRQSEWRQRNIHFNVMQAN